MKEELWCVFASFIGYSSCGFMDHVWVPRSSCQDDRLIEAMAQVLEDTSVDDAIAAFNRLVCKDSGIDGSRSLVDDLIIKSGDNCKPFIESALEELERLVKNGLAPFSIPKILLTKPSPNLSKKFQVDSEIFQACLWDLFASLIVLILSGEDYRSCPASCFDTMKRTKFLEQKIFVYSGKQTNNSY